MKLSVALRAALFFSLTLIFNGASAENLSALFAPALTTEEPIIHKTCSENTLANPKATAALQIARVCLSSSKVFSEAIHDFQIFSVEYKNGDSADYSLLPFSVDSKISYELNSNVLKGRIITKTSSGFAQYISEGAVFLVYKRIGLSGNGNPAIVGRTPLGEPFFSVKDSGNPAR